jgi:hypothetical protein
MTRRIGNLLRMVVLATLVIVTLVIATLDIASVGIGPPPALAQFQTFQPLERLEVVVWPEYDQVAALVMYRAWLPPDAVLPTTVVLPMRSSVGTPSAVAKRPLAGGLLLTPYTVESDDDANGKGRQWVYVQTDAPEIRLEYYADLEIDGTSRSFSFEWPGGPAINSIAYEVMQPIGASGLSISPSSGRPELAADGLYYQREEIGSVPEGGQFFINVEYAKSTPNLTAAALGTFAPPPPPATSSPPPAGSQFNGQSSTEPGNQPWAASQQPDSESPAEGSIWLTVLPVVLVAGLIVFWFVLRDAKIRR